MIRRILISLIAISALAACVSLGGLSLFTESVDNGGNAFTSGSVDISTSPASAFITMSNMAPGDSVTDQVTVTDGGTLELRYAMTTVATNTDSLNLRRRPDAHDQDGGHRLRHVRRDAALYGHARQRRYRRSGAGRGHRRPDAGGQRQRGPVLQGGAPFGRNGS